MNNKNRLKLAFAGCVLFFASLACQSLFPKVITPGSFEEDIANGNIRFEGKGNLSYEGCQDPTAIVKLIVSAQTKTYEGQEYYDFINPVTVNAETTGTFSMASGCEKEKLDEKYNWPAKGIYYPKEGKILFFGCSLTNGKAEGEAYLNGEESDLYFEGEYTCNGEDGSSVYGIAFTVLPVGK